MTDLKVDIEVSDADLEKLGALQKTCGLASIDELVGAALKMFGSAVEEVSKGRVIGSINDNEKCYRVLSLPALENVARAALQP